jgi:riboflavin kinase/FMN adenylyltransferase
MIDMTTWYHSTVHHGNKQGRTISFPTVNLDPSVWPSARQPGVYAAEVKIGEYTFKGALYFGPRTVKKETHNVLEIFLLDFSKEIYGQKLSFRLHQFIRGVIHFNSFEEMKLQIAKDVNDVRASFDTTVDTTEPLEKNT